MLIIRAMKRMSDFPDLLTLGEAAYLLTISTKTLRRMVDAGEIEHIMVYRSKRIRKQDLIDYINDQTGDKTNG